MDTEKKEKKNDDRRMGNGGVNEDRGKSLTSEEGHRNGGRTVTEEEVDEFFAILRRLHVAAQYLETDDGGKGRKVSAARKRKRVETNDVSDGDGGGARVGLPERGLDLNLKP